MAKHSRFSANKEKPKKFKETLFRLVKFISKFKFLIIALVIISIIYTVVHVYSNILMKNMVAALGTFDSDKMIFTKNPDEQEFYLNAIYLIISYVIYCVFQYLSSLFSAYLSVYTVRKLRGELFNKIVHLPIKYVDTHPHGDIMSRMTNDVDNVANAISQTLSSLVSGVLTIIGCLVIMIYYSPLLTLVSLFVLLLTLLLTGLLSKFVRPLFVKQQEILGKLNSQTEEMVTGYKTVVVNNRQDIAIDNFKKSSSDLTKIGIKAQIFSGSMGPMMNFIGNIGYFLVCLFGSLFILNGIGNTLLGAALTIDVVIMFLSTTKQFTRPINEIAQLYSSLISALAGAERVFKILDEESEDNTKKIEVNSKDIKGYVKFENVNFGYEPNQLIIKDLTLDIEQGHKIALVGATGSGKTTIVNLLLRFYDINSGKICIDDIDISQMSRDDLRSCISIVLQDPMLFGDTIENNIKYGNENASDEDVDKALEFANCMSFINKLPLGKKTILTEGASNISQGQRQLLTIARAVLANPKILILDEATSSVDTRTEKRIQDALEKIMENRTSIVIAHRLSTIQDADVIVVLEKGHIVEKGNHKELLKLNGVYKKLYETQFKGMQI